MKKIFLPSATGCIAFIAVTFCANAQPSNNSIPTAKDSAIYAKNEKNETGENAVNSSAAYFSTAEMKSINKKAFKSFTADFSNPADVKWFQLKDGFAAYCTENNIRNRSVYDKRGNWLYTAKSYDETKLPKEIRSLAKRTYFDFAITGVQEFHVADKIIYLLYMKDDTTCQTVRICDYEMDLIDSFGNSH